MSITSDVEICSNALSYIGVDPIMSLTTDTTQRGKLCGRIYAPTRDNLLQEHKWNFALTRVALNRTTDTPVYKYAYIYQLPVDLLQLEEVDPADIDYRIEGTGLLTDEAAISVLYVRRVTDTTLFTSKFQTALEYKLAQLMAIPLTGDLNKAVLMEGLFNQTMGIGKSLDSKADPVQEYRADNILEARW